MPTVPATSGHDPSPPRALLVLATGYLAGYLAAAGEVTRVAVAGALTGLLAWLARG